MEVIYPEMVFDPKLERISGEIEAEKNILREAYRYAWEHSHDPKTRVGAVLEHGQVLTYGANHFPRELQPTSEQLNDRNWKYQYIIHAESAVIIAAARQERGTKGTTMYMPWVPCIPCAAMIIDAGIEVLIGHQAMIEKTPERWWESTMSALELLKKTGVEVKVYDGKIGSVHAIFDGNIWEP